VYDHVGGGEGRRRGCVCVFGFFSSILPVLRVPSSPLVWSTGAVAAGTARRRRGAPRSRPARRLDPAGRPTLPRRRGRAAKHTPRAVLPPTTDSGGPPSTPTPVPASFAWGTHRPAGRGGPSASRRSCLAGRACGDAVAPAAGRQLLPLLPLPPRSLSAGWRGGHVLAAAAGRRRAVTAGVGDERWLTAVAAAAGLGGGDGRMGGGGTAGMTAAMLGAAADGGPARRPPMSRPKGQPIRVARFNQISEETLPSR